VNKPRKLAPLLHYAHFGSRDGKEARDAHVDGVPAMRSRDTRGSAINERTGTERKMSTAQVSCCECASCADWCHGSEIVPKSAVEFVLRARNILLLLTPARRRDSNSFVSFSPAAPVCSFLCHRCPSKTNMIVGSTAWL
jgi:hypothetical protein